MHRFRSVLSCKTSTGSGILIAILSSIALIGCAVRQLPQTRPRVALPGFSFVPPAGDDWEAIPRLKTTRADFASRDGSNLIWARAASFEVPTPTAADPDEILDTAEAVAVLEQFRGLGDGAEVVWTSSRPEEIAGAECLRNQSLFKDKATYSLSNSVLCSHPESPAHIVLLDYSEKWREPSWQRNDAMQRNTFLNSLQFGPVAETIDHMSWRKSANSSLASQY